MEKIRKIIREPMTSVVFVIGLTISCFILINVAGLVEKISNENKVLNNFKYTASGFLDCQMALEKYEAELADKLDSNSGEKIYNEEYKKKEWELVDKVVEVFTEETRVNTYLEILVRVNDMIDEYTAYIVMAVNEDINIECVEYYDIDTRNGVIIGESLLVYTKEIEGIRTIEIGKNIMQVIGVIENQMSGGVDNSVYLFWNNCDEQVREYLMQSIYDDIGFLEYHIKSNSDISEQYEEFISLMEALDIQNEIMDARYEGDYQNYWYRMYNSIFMGASLIFSIFNCFSVSYLWIVRRKSELAIRMAYGYSKGQIRVMIFKDIIKLCVPASILAIVVQNIYTVAEGNSILGEMLIMRILFVCIGMLGIAILTSIYVLEKIKKMSTVDILSDI